jgi:hypothetical protein
LKGEVLLFGTLFERVEKSGCEQKKIISKNDHFLNKKSKAETEQHKVEDNEVPDPPEVKFQRVLRNSLP